MTTQQEGNKMTSEPITIITHDLLRSRSPCQDGYRRFCELFPSGADLKTAMNGLIADGHDDWSYWLFCKCRDNKMFLDIVSAGYRTAATGTAATGTAATGTAATGTAATGTAATGTAATGTAVFLTLTHRKQSAFLAKTVRAMFGKARQNQTFCFLT